MATDSGHPNRSSSVWWGCAWADGARSCRRSGCAGRRSIAPRDTSPIAAPARGVAIEAKAVSDRLCGFEHSQRWSDPRLAGGPFAGPFATSGRCRVTSFGPSTARQLTNRLTQLSGMVARGSLVGGRPRLPKQGPCGDPNGMSQHFFSHGAPMGRPIFAKPSGAIFPVFCCGLWGEAGLFSKVFFWETLGGLPNFFRGGPS